MTRLTLKKSESGLTLVEMMVVAGILSFLMLGFSTYMYYQGKSNQTQQNRENMNALQSSVVNAAAQEDTLNRSESLKINNSQ